MSLNLCRTFLSLKTSFLIIFCKKKFWDRFDQKLDMTAAAARTCETAHVQRRRFIFPRAIFYPKRPLFHIFKSFLCLINFCCYFSHVPRDNKSHLQKESGPKVLSFSWNLALRGRRRNDTHYENIGVDVNRIGVCRKH